MAGLAFVRLMDNSSLISGKNVEASKWIDSTRSR